MNTQQQNWLKAKSKKFLCNIIYHCMIYFVVSTPVQCVQMSIPFSFLGVVQINKYISSYDKCSNSGYLRCILFLSVLVMAIIHLDDNIFLLFESGCKIIWHWASISLYKERKCSCCIIRAQHELTQAAICGFAQVPGEKTLFILASSDKHLHF